jgi:hypothetical protein
MHASRFSAFSTVHILALQCENCRKRNASGRLAGSLSVCAAASPSPSYAAYREIL